MKDVVKFHSTDYPIQQCGSAAATTKMNDSSCGNIGIVLKHNVMKVNKPPVRLPFFTIEAKFKFLNKNIYGSQKSEFAYGFYCRT